MRAAFVAVAALLAACSSSASSKMCIQGASVACSCTNGAPGAQVCNSDGTLGACVCNSGTGTGGSGDGGAAGSGGTTGSGGTGGLGGATGTGGTAGSGGTGGTVGAGGTGGTVGAGGTGGTVGAGGTGGGTPMSASGAFTVTYDGTITKMYSMCFQSNSLPQPTCLATYIPGLPEGIVGLDLDNNQWGINIDARKASSGSGYEVSVEIDVRDPSLPAGDQGNFDTTGGAPIAPNFVPMASSCVTFSQFSLQTGGGMAGTLDCTLTGSNSTAGHTAVVQGSFQGTF